VYRVRDALEAAQVKRKSLYPTQFPRQRGRLDMVFCG